jgi:hypothetical protein
VTALLSATSFAAELTLKVELAPRITLSRPAARMETGSTWIPLHEDADIGILPDPPCTLRLRLRAVDGLGAPLADPPWLVDVATRTEGSSWEALPDLAAPLGEHLTAAHAVTSAPRTYRVTVRLAGSDLMATHELVVAQRGSDAADDDDDDVLYDPEDDLLPPPKPIDGGSGGLAATSLVAIG